MRYLKYRVKKLLEGIPKRLAALRGSASYWTSHMVANHDWSDADASLQHFLWRNAQYPGYIELMPVSGANGLVMVDMVVVLVTIWWGLVNSLSPRN